MYPSFWVNDPCILLSDYDIFPLLNMNVNENLNALTRLILILTVIFYFMEYEWWWIFLLFSILFVVMLYARYCDCEQKYEKENFSVSPTYLSNDFSQTVAPPLIAEEWHKMPLKYEMNENYPAGPHEHTNVHGVEFESPTDLGRDYPYGQYITNTNLLPPREHELSKNFSCGTENARLYANNEFLRSDLAFRENMTQIYKNQLNRRFRHTTTDTFSPFQSF